MVYFRFGFSSLLVLGVLSCFQNACAMDSDDGEDKDKTGISFKQHDPLDDMFMYAEWFRENKFEKRAKIMYKVLADEGHAESMGMLSKIYDEEKKHGKAAYYLSLYNFKKAVKAECENTHDNYDNMELYGYHICPIVQHIPEDIHLLHTAAQQGNAEAQYKLGKLYTPPEDDDEVDSEIPVNASYFLEKDEHTAIQFYWLAIAQGHLAAQFELGKIYDSKRRDTSSKTRSSEFGTLTLNLWQPAAELKHIPSMRGLAELYWEGSNVLKQDQEKALELYKEILQLSEPGDEREIDKMVYDDYLYEFHESLRLPMVQ